VAVLVVALVGAACSTGPPTAVAEPTPSPTSASQVAASGGCGSTAVLRGSIPAWLDAAGAHNNPTFLPYVIAHPPLAAGFLFVYPLQAGLGDSVPTKILWVVRTPRTGSQLTIDGHPLDASQPTVHETQPDNSSPGEIYPDGVQVPTPGCWQFDLHWASSHTQIELNYSASSSTS
jgi:hypothetical protein